MSSRPNARSRSMSFMSCAAFNPNFDFSPPLCAQRPAPSDDSLMRTPAVGVTPRSSAACEQHIQLAQLLEHDEHLVSELLAHQGEAHELLVLVAVADDDVLASTRSDASTACSSGFDPHSSPTPCALPNCDDLLDDVALLIDLDRIDGRVAAAVLELLDRAPANRSLSDSMRDCRMSEKRSSTGSATPCSSRSCARSNRSSARSGRSRSGRTTT